MKSTNPTSDALKAKIHHPKSRMQNKKSLASTKSTKSIKEKQHELSRSA